MGKFISSLVRECWSREKEVRGDDGIAMDGRLRWRGSVSVGFGVGVDVFF